MSSTPRPYAYRNAGLLRRRPARRRHRRHRRTPPPAAVAATAAGCVVDVISATLAGDHAKSSARIKLVTFGYRRRSRSLSTFTSASSPPLPASLRWQGSQTARDQQTCLVRTTSGSATEARRSRRSSCRRQRSPITVEDDGSADEAHRRPHRFTFGTNCCAAAGRCRAKYHAPFSRSVTPAHFRRRVTSSACISPPASIAASGSSLPDHCLPPAIAVVSSKPAPSAKARPVLEQVQQLRRRLRVTSAWYRRNAGSFTSAQYVVVRTAEPSA